jgi:hypothetical protein
MNGLCLNEQPGFEGAGRDHAADAATLRSGELQRAYPGTYASWRSLRYERQGAEIDPSWRTFPGFLRDLGPRPGKSFTVDRIDRNCPTYGPGLCRWADKSEQANNRSTTIMLTYQGETVPLTVWARRTGQDPENLRRRHRLGWSDQEVIEGRPTTPPSVQRPGSGSAIGNSPWPLGKTDVWEIEYRKHLAEFDHGGNPPTKHEFFYSSLVNSFVPRANSHMSDHRISSFMKDLHDIEDQLAASYAPDDELISGIHEAVPTRSGRIKLAARPAPPVDHAEIAAEIADLEAKHAELSGFRDRGFAHLERVREQGLRDMKKRSIKALGAFLDLYPGERRHAEALLTGGHGQTQILPGRWADQDDGCL